MSIVSPSMQARHNPEEAALHPHPERWSGSLGCVLCMATDVELRSHTHELWCAPCPASTILAGWRQSVLPVHLLGLTPLLGCVGAVAGDVKLQDDGVMDHPINRRRGGHGVGEDAFRLRGDQR